VDLFVVCLALLVLACIPHSSFWWEANIPQIAGRAVGLLSFVAGFFAADSGGPLLWLATAGFAASGLLGVLGLVVRRWSGKIDQAAVTEARVRARRAR